MGDLLTDYRRPSPDLVTNIRTLGGARNKEILGQVAEGRRHLDTLLRIMRNFTYIRAPGTPPGTPGVAVEPPGLTEAEPAP